MSEAQMQARIEALEKDVADLKARPCFKCLKANLSEMIDEIIRTELSKFYSRDQVIPQCYQSIPPHFHRKTECHAECAQKQSRREVRILLEGGKSLPLLELFRAFQDSGSRPRRR